MNWYYADAGQQRGPVTYEEMSQLVARGIVRPETLVWNSTLTNWQAWSTVAPSAPLPPPVTGPTADGRYACNRCQQLFSVEDTVEIAGRRYCGACKPLALQQLSEGGAPLPGASALLGGEAGTLSEAEFLARGYSMDATSALTEAWELMFRRPAVVWLGCVLLWAAFIGASMVLGMLQLIPFAGILFGAMGTLLSAAIEAGQANLFLRERRGWPNDVASGFAFIGPRFWDILLTYLPHSLMTLAMLGGMAAVGISTAMAGIGTPANQLATLGPMLAAPMILFGLVIMLGFLYLHTCLRFAPILVLDKGYRWTAALSLSWRFVNQHFWQNFWLLFLGGLVMMAGACVCLIGAIVSYPLAYGMAGVVYDRHFRDLAPASR